MSLQQDLLRLTARLRQKQYTVGFAESCTGGLLSSEFTKISGVSDVFVGSVVSYANSVKTNVLQVSSKDLQTQGAVSEPVVLQMARGLCKNLQCQVATSISGVAGPSGGTVDKPVGTVWIAACGPEFEVAKKYHFEGDREQVQKQAAQAAVLLILENL